MRGAGKAALITALAAVITTLALAAILQGMDPQIFSQLPLEKIVGYGLAGGILGTGVILLLVQAVRIQIQKSRHAGFVDRLIGILNDSNYDVRDRIGVAGGSNPSPFVIQLNDQQSAASALLSGVCEKGKLSCELHVFPTERDCHEYADKEVKEKKASRESLEHQEARGQAITQI